MLLVLKPPAKVSGNRSFAEVLVGLRKILALSSSMKGLSSNYDVSAPKGQAAARLSMFEFVFGDEGDP